MMINDMFITHGYWAISIISEAFVYKLDLNEAIVSNICQVKDKLMNINSSGKLCIYGLHD